MQSVPNIAPPARTFSARAAALTATTGKAGGNAVPGAPAADGCTGTGAGDAATVVSRSEGGVGVAGWGAPGMDG